MKKILHSGEFLDYDGNTIRVSFYDEKHLWVSKTSITTSRDGGDYIVEVWSDAGDAEIYDSQYNWISDPIFIESYRNSEGHRVYKYGIKISAKPGIQPQRNGSLNVGVEITGDININEYDENDLHKTITITQLQ